MTEENFGGDPQAGEAVWIDSTCGSCHTLAAGGYSSTVGPNLDTLQPSFDAVVDQVTNGGGGMRAFVELSEQQILDVAAYVVASTTG